MGNDVVAAMDLIVRHAPLYQVVHRVLHYLRHRRRWNIGIYYAALPEESVIVFNI